MTRGRADPMHETPRPRPLTQPQLTFSRVTGIRSTPVMRTPRSSAPPPASAPSPPARSRRPARCARPAYEPRADFGDIPLRRWRPDPASRRAQNAAGVVQAAREVAERVEAAIRSGHVPVVLGGDCTVGVGTVAGARAASDEPLGLVYFDMHPDLNTPETVATGTLDWMGVAHMLGLPGTVPELAAVARLAPQDILLFAREPSQTKRAEHEAIDSPRHPHHRSRDGRRRPARRRPPGARADRPPALPRALRRRRGRLRRPPAVGEHRPQRRPALRRRDAGRSRSSPPTRASPASPSPSTTPPTAPRTGRRRPRWRPRFSAR